MPKGWRSEITHCPRGHEYTAANTKQRKDGGRDCRACARDQARRRYRDRSSDPEWRSQHAKRGYAYVQENRAMLDQIRRERGCIDCGTRSGELHFDHRPNTTKLFNLGRPHYSKEVLLAEVAKCDVRCNSCHSRRHGIERGGLNGVVWGNESANTATLEPSA